MPCQDREPADTPKVPALEVPALDVPVLLVNVQRVPLGTRDGLIVGLSGELDNNTATLLRQALDPLLTAQDPVHLIVDASRLKLCDSSGLAELINAYHRVQRSGGQVALAGARGMVARLFHRTAMDTIMDTYDSVAEAEAALTCQP
uniref:anti-sigma factor antagonist n=1 Tax=Nonomuraea sp. CA-252377 TaxID=3240003 RepID=UPI003F49408C